MKNKIQKILDAYHEEYENIFKVFDFSVDRFTEENQTVNFCRAVQKECAGALVWYEYPWENEEIKNLRKSKSRFDAVIYLPKEKALIIVESKCLRHKGKYEAMHSDLERIINENKNVKIKNKIETVYAVILADFWNGKRKNSQYYNLQNYWKEGVDTKELKQDEKKWFDKFVDLTNNNLENPDWNCKENLIDNKNYHLLSVIGKVK